MKKLIIAAQIRHSHTKQIIAHCLIHSLSDYLIFQEKCVDRHILQNRRLNGKWLDTQKVKGSVCRQAGRAALWTQPLGPHFLLNWTHTEDSLELRGYKSDSNSHWVPILHSLLLKCLKRFHSLCSVERGLSGIRT